MDRILQIQMLHHRRQIRRIVIHIMPIARLRRPPMPAPVMRHHAIPMLQKEQHLRIPVIGRKRPAMAEHNRLPRPPVLVVNLNAVLRLNRRHSNLLHGSY